MNHFKLTRGNQVTLPKRVRKALNLKAGDTVYFNIFEGNHVGIGKAHAPCKEEQAILLHTFSEWSSKEDEEAFAHFQE